ncbi:MAG: TadE/TadG family type IV pilus assembly protein [Arenibacterium sp.]
MRKVSRFIRNDDGSFLVEYVFALLFFLLLVLMIVDFSRLAFHNVTANRAMHVAARVAAVRPPACAGVPTFIQRAPIPTGTVPPRFGTRCNAGTSICLDPGTISCDGTSANATSSEIWNLVSGTLPNGSTPANLRFSYNYDDAIGFLGGPYSPLVTVEIQNVDFDFISPLGALIGLTGGVAGNTVGARLRLASMSVTMPGEDLAQGGN